MIDLTCGIATKPDGQMAREDLPKTNANACTTRKGWGPREGLVRRQPCSLQQVGEAPLSRAAALGRFTFPLWISRHQLGSQEVQTQEAPRAGLNLTPPAAAALRC